MSLVSNILNSPLFSPSLVWEIFERAFNLARLFCLKTEGGITFAYIKPYGDYCCRMFLPFSTQGYIFKTTLFIYRSIKTIPTDSEKEWRHYSVILLILVCCKTCFRTYQIIYLDKIDGVFVRKCMRISRYLLRKWCLFKAI